MKRILAVIEHTHDAMAWYRSVLPLKRLAQAGYCEVNFMYANNEPKWDLLIDYDILFLQRPHSEQYVTLAGLARLHKLKVWVDFDDPLWSINPDSPVHAYYHNQDTRNALAKCIDLSDVISVSTPILAQSIMDNYSREAVVIVNSADLSGLQWMATSLKKAPNKPTLCWRGSRTHEEDLYEMREALWQIEDVAWRFYGYDHYHVRKNLKDYTHIDNMDFTLYQTTLRRDPGQILIVPLCDNHFNHCKSDIAAIEAVVAGMIPIVPKWWELGYHQKGLAQDIRDVLALSDTEKSVLWTEYASFVKSRRDLVKTNVLRRELIERL